MKRAQKKLNTGMKLKGFFRVQIEEDGKIVGDSGWLENRVTNLGLQNYMAYPLLGASGSTPTIGAIALGTGTEPATDGTTLPGEIMSSTQRRTNFTTAFSSRTSSTGSCTAQWTCTFYSSDSFLSGAVTLQNIGLFNNTSTNATLFVGNTYTTSSCNTNQNVNVTYQVRLG